MRPRLEERTSELRYMHDKEGHHHDAIEYTGYGDITTPAKSMLQPQYRRAAGPLERSLAETLGLEYPWPEAVHEVDLRVASTECYCLLVPGAQLEIAKAYQPYGLKIQTMMVEQKWYITRQQFLDRYTELTGNEVVIPA